MLLVYLEPLILPQRQLLASWERAVHYWPRSYVNTEVFNAAVPSDWWLLFNNPVLADYWLMRYSEHTRVVRTLFDD